MGGVKGAFSPLNPLKHPLGGGESDGHAKIFSNYFPFQLPPPMQFKYEVAMKIKVPEAQVPLNVDGAHIADIKAGANFKMPFIYGDWNSENTAFDDIYKKKKFNFQVGASLALANTKKQQEALNNTKFQVGTDFAFDVSCSTEKIGSAFDSAAHSVADSAALAAGLSISAEKQAALKAAYGAEAMAAELLGSCQLKKITVKVKGEEKREANNVSALSTIKIAVDAVYTLLHNQLAEQILFGSNTSKKNEFTDVLNQVRGDINTVISIATIMEPPTRHRLSNGFALIDDLGLLEPLGSYAYLVQDLAVYLDSMYKYGGKLKNVFGINGLGYEETAAQELSYSFQFLNSDVLDGKFKSGFKPVGNPINKYLKTGDATGDTVVMLVMPKIPQVFSIEYARTGASEVKLEFGSDEAGKMTYGASIDSKAIFGFTIPLDRRTARYLREQNSEKTTVTQAEIDQVNELNGSDPHNLGASKNWGKVMNTELGSIIENDDGLTLPVFMSIIY